MLCVRTEQVSFFILSKHPCLLSAHLQLRFEYVIDKALCMLILSMQRARVEQLKPVVSCICKIGNVSLC